MPRRLISTNSTFERDFGYSRAVVDGDHCFISGTTGYDYATMVMPAGTKDQTRNCWETISGVLKEAGFALEDIVRAMFYIVNGADAVDVARTSGPYLANARPAATMVTVAGLLTPEIKVEIEITAMRRRD